MPFWSRTLSKETLWNAVFRAARKLDPVALKTALEKYRKTYPDTAIDKESPVFIGIPGNSFALAAEHLKNTALTDQSTQVIKLLCDDWVAHGWRDDAARAPSTNRPIIAILEYVVSLGEPERIKLALGLCHNYFAQPTYIITDRRRLLDAALRLKQNRPECLRELGPAHIVPSDIPAFVEDTLKKPERPSPNGPFPPLDKETLEALWSLPAVGSDDASYIAAQRDCIQHLLYYRPQKSLLDVVHAQQYLARINPEHCTDYGPRLQSYVCNAPAPDAARLAADAQHRAEYEDTRLGILESYMALLPAMLSVDLSRPLLRDYTQKVVSFTAPGIKQRFEQYASAPTAPETQTARNELLLYQQIGVLPDLFDLAGPATGFATDLEYKTALRERILDAISLPANARDEVMDMTCWAEYVRTKPLEREGTATVNYTLGG